MTDFYLEFFTSSKNKIKIFLFTLIKGNSTLALKIISIAIGYL